MEAGTDIKDFPYGHEELTVDPAITLDDLEMYAVYSFKKGQLKFKRKYWQRFKERRIFQIKILNRNKYFLRKNLRIYIQF